MIKNILTIAGTDPTGGAGIQADLKVFSALGTYGMSAITAIVAQNTQGVRAFETLDPSFVADQIDAVFEDVEVAAVKIGMVATAAIAEAISERLHHHHAKNIVLDPVMVAKSGDLLLQQDAVDAIRELLVPIADVITPNLPEAGVLIQKDAPKSREEMYEILPDLHKLGKNWVLLKGGHLTTPDSNDILYGATLTKELQAPRLNTKNLHGTGCTLSAAVAAYLSRYDMEESATRAKKYLHQALLASTQLNVGKGRGPVHHFYAAWSET